MPITQNANRQDTLMAEVVIDVADATLLQPVSGALENAVQLPQGAIVIGGAAVVEVAFNSTTNTLSFGDTALATRYLSAISLLAVGRTALTQTGLRHAAEFLRTTYASTGPAATTGRVRLLVEYVVSGRRATSTQG